jgi:hypothetical protein
MIGLGNENSAGSLREDSFDGPGEKLGQFECQRKTGIKPAGLNRIDRLPGNSELLGKVGLAPIPFGTEHA